MNPIQAIFGIAGRAWGAYQGRKAAAEAGAQKVEEKKVQLRAARVEAQITTTLARAKAKSERFTQRLAAASDHDARVQANRQFSKMDELLIVTFLAIFVLPFLAPILDLIAAGIACVVSQCPAAGWSLGLADVVAQGWAAHGYDKAPLWFEFAMVGILVSTLGLMQLFNSFFGALKNKFFGGKNAK